MLSNGLYKSLFFIAFFSLVSVSHAKTSNVCDSLSGNWQGTWVDELLSVRHGASAVASYVSGALRLEFTLSDGQVASYLGTCNENQINVRITSKNTHHYSYFMSTILKDNHMKLYDGDRLIIVELFKISN